MSIAVAREVEHRAPCTVRTHRCCEPDLAGTTGDLVGIRAVALAQRGKAPAELDHVAIAVVPLFQQGKILDDLVDRHKREYRMHERWTEESLSPLPNAELDGSPQPPIADGR